MLFTRLRVIGDLSRDLGNDEIVQARYVGGHFLLGGYIPAKNQFLSL
jgi:hypothetical protein